MKRRALLAGGLLLPALPAAGQDTYPSRPIQMIVPFPPGGVADITGLPVADRLQGRPAAYELDQFAPIALVSADPTVLVVRADGPYKTLKDLVDAAKAKPDTINYGSSGVYGTLHVAMEIFAAAADIKLFHIPYHGGGPAGGAPPCGSQRL